LDPSAALAAAIKANDADRVRQLLDAHGELRARINEPLPGFSFGTTALLAAVSRDNLAMIDALLAAGADINRRSDWWAGSFGVLDSVDPGLAPSLIERGARVDVHAAARLGMLDALQSLIAADPALVHARGGDGQTPLHFASTVAIAEYLLRAGADIDARDIDHESTPAQWMVGPSDVLRSPRDRQDVARYLVARGCRTDILMAAALGDRDRVRSHLDRAPEQIRMAVTARDFPRQDPRSGGAIYIWTLGANKTAHLVAHDFGHEDIFRLLMERSPAGLQLAVACEIGDEAAVAALLAAEPHLARTLSDAERRKLPDAAQDENATALRLMLAAGWPLDAPGQHGATALHWAAFHGNLAMVRELIRHGAPLEIKDEAFDGTPLNWALHGSTHGWRCKTGDYAASVEALLAAGAERPPLRDDHDVSDPVRDVLARHKPNQ